MKRSPLLVAPLMLVCVAPMAHADAYDCFPLCAQTMATPDARLHLCDHQAVREVARIDAQLKPVKELYGIVTDPTGFALRQVSEHVVHIPPWVGYAMNPQGAIRAKVMERVREEAKKQMGLKDACVEEPIAEEAPGAAPGAGG